MELRTQKPMPADAPTGELTVMAAAQSIVMSLPPDAILADESNTSGLGSMPPWLQYGPKYVLPLPLPARLALADQANVCEQA